MFWNEDDAADARPSPDTIVDILFSIACKRIPVDHAYPLSCALRSALPWVADEPRLAVHSIYGAGSQNGWERPEHGEDTLLMVSRRTKLGIRAPATRADELLSTLPGIRLEVAGHALTLGPGKIKPLSQETTIFARYVAMETDAEPEEHFLAAAARTLEAMDIQIRKALCGKTTRLRGPDGIIQTRSLMLAGLTREESIRLQQRGLGPHRLMGCGIFIPHKGIDSLQQQA